MFEEGSIDDTVRVQLVGDTVQPRFVYSVESWLPFFTKNVSGIWINDYVGRHCFSPSDFDSAVEIAELNFCRGCNRQGQYLTNSLKLKFVALNKHNQLGF